MENPMPAYTQYWHPEDGAAPYLDSNGMAYVAHRSIIRTTLTKAETWGGMNLTLKRFLPTFRVAVA